MSQEGRQHGSTAERLARIETRLDDGSKRHEAIDKKLDQHGQKIDDIHHDVVEIKLNLTRMQGFGRGIVFAFSSVAAMIGAAIAAVWDRLTDW